RQGTVTTPAQARQQVAWLREADRRATAIVDGTDALMGLVALTIDPEDRNGWFSYWLHAAHRGQGLAERTAVAGAERGLARPRAAGAWSGSSWGTGRTIPLPGPWPGRPASCTRAPSAGSSSSTDGGWTCSPTGGSSRIRRPPSPDYPGSHDDRTRSAAPQGLRHLRPAPLARGARPGARRARADRHHLPPGRGADRISGRRAHRAGPAH